MQHKPRVPIDNRHQIKPICFHWYIGKGSYYDDSDISQAPTTVVPGGVFLMFRNGEVSKGLVDKLRGRKLTKIYAF